LDNLGFTVGDGALAGYSWGFTSKNVLSPRLVVNDPTAEALGHYQSDGKISAARKKVGNFESVFIGEFGIFGRCATPSNSCHSGFAPDPLRVILQTTGVHIWSTAGDTVHTDGKLLVIHAAAAGPDAISLPAGVTATPLGGGTSSIGTINVSFARVGQTLWFQLSHAP